MTREALDQAKKDLLHAIHTQLVAAAALHRVPFANVADAIEGYGVNMTEDFFYDALCEIQQNEERGTHGATEHV